MFDPEYDLCLTWPNDGAPQVVIFSMWEGSELYLVPDGGFVIESSDQRLLIGQSETFMASVRAIWAALENGSRS